MAVNKLFESVLREGRAISDETMIDKIMDNLTKMYDGDRQAAKEAFDEAMSEEDMTLPQLLHMSKMYV